ncbi:unnamed protein product [Amoebophrya sp. A120]|nr:unnamed protein product [Amoebophrya sp. A120]|eukprot:GSA120T00015844001.1
MSFPQQPPGFAGVRHPPSLTDALGRKPSNGAIQPAEAGGASTTSAGGGVEQTSKKENVGQWQFTAAKKPASKTKPNAGPISAAVVAQGGSSSSSSTGPSRGNSVPTSRKSSSVSLGGNNAIAASQVPLQQQTTVTFAEQVAASPVLEVPEQDIVEESSVMFQQQPNHHSISTISYESTSGISSQDLVEQHQGLSSSAAGTMKIRAKPQTNKSGMHYQVSPFRFDQIEHSIEAEDAASKILAEHSILLPKLVPLERGTAAANHNQAMKQRANSYGAPGGPGSSSSSSSSSSSAGGLGQSNPMNNYNVRASELRGFTKSSQLLQEDSLFLNDNFGGLLAFGANNHNQSITSAFSGTDDGAGLDGSMSSSLVNSKHQEYLTSRLQDTVLRIVLEGILNMHHFQGDDFAFWLQNLTLSSTNHVVLDLLHLASSSAGKKDDRKEEEGGSAVTSRSGSKKATADPSSDNPTGKKEDRLKQRFDTLRAYLKDLSNLRQKQNQNQTYDPNSLPGAEDVTEDLIKRDVTFFEPLQHLPDSAQELTREIVREKMKTVATKLTEDYTQRMKDMEKDYKEKLMRAKMSNSIRLGDQAEYDPNYANGGYGSGYGSGEQNVMEAYERKIQQLEELLSEQTEKSRQLEKKHNQIADVKIDLESSVDIFKLENSQLKEQLEELQTKMKNAELVDELLQEKDNNEKKLLDYEIELKMLREELSAKEQELTQEKAETIAQREHASKFANVKETEVYKQLESDFNELKQDFQREQQTSNALKSTDKELRQRTAKQEIDLEKQRKKLKMQSIQLEEQEKLRNDLQKKIEDLRKEMSAMRKTQIENQHLIHENEQNKQKIQNEGSSSDVKQFAEMLKQKSRKQESELLMLRDALDQVHLRLDDRERKLLNLQAKKAKYKNYLKAKQDNSGEQVSNLFSSGNKPSYGGGNRAAGMSNNMFSNAKIAQQKQAVPSQHASVSVGIDLSDSESDISEAGFDMDEIPVRQSTTRGSGTEDYDEAIDVEQEEPKVEQIAASSPAAPATGTSTEQRAQTADPTTEEPPVIPEGSSGPPQQQVLNRESGGGVEIFAADQQFIEQKKSEQARTSQNNKPPGASSPPKGSAPIKNKFPRYSEPAIFSQLYTDFVSRLEKMREYRDEICPAREGVLLKIYEAQKKIVEFLEPHKIEKENPMLEQYLEGEDVDNYYQKRPSDQYDGAMQNNATIKNRSPSFQLNSSPESYFAEFVTLLKKKEQEQRRGSHAGIGVDPRAGGGNLQNSYNTPYHQYHLNAKSKRERQQSLPDILKTRGK